MCNYDFDGTWDIGKIEELQFKLLKKQIQYVSETSQFYKRKFRNVGLTLSDIRTIKDIEKIPFTTKEDLTKYNDDFICVSNEEIVDYCSTTGTTGKPVMVPLTFKEWRQEIELKKEFFLDASLSIAV
jgi:phenylacetate-CoA ligase